VKLLFSPSWRSHQLVHALAVAMHYRRRVREFGSRFCTVLPTFYVDVTDLFWPAGGPRSSPPSPGGSVHLVLGAGLVHPSHAHARCAVPPVSA